MKNLVKKTLATVAAATGLSLGTQALAASGDIWSIMQCNVNGETEYCYSTNATVDATSGVTIDNPIRAGQDLYFRIRLWNRRAGDVSLGTRHYTHWVRQNIIGGDPEPLQIGIYPAGTNTTSTIGMRYATLDNVDNTSHEAFTDLIFKYTVQPGDFALPMDIAVTNTTGDIQPSYTCSDFKGYYIEPVSAKSWEIVEYDPATGANTGNKLTWQFGTPVADVDYDAVTEGPTTTTYWDTLEKAFEPDGIVTSGLGSGVGFADQCKFYIQTVVFDEAVTWKVRENSTQMENEEESAAIKAKFADDTFKNAIFYVWSDNEDAVKLVAGDPDFVELMPGTVVSNSTSGPVTRDVAKITMNGNRAPFAIRGIAKGAKANLVLSANPSYTVMSGGKQKIDYITVPVECIDPPEPSLDASVASTLTATAERFGKGSPLTVKIANGAWPGSSPLVVTLVPDAADWSETLGISASDSTTSASDFIDPSTTPITFTIQPGADSSTSEKYYVYALGCANKESTVTFTPTFSDAAATAYFGSRIKSASVTVTSTPTAVLANAEDLEYIVKNVPVGIDIEVGDAYRDEQYGKTSGGYKLEIRRDTTEVPFTSTNLFANCYIDAGHLRVKNDGGDYELPQIVFNSVSQTASAFRVISPVGKVATEWIPFVHPVTSKDVTVNTGVEAEDGSWSTETLEEGAPGARVTVGGYGALPEDTKLYVFFVATNDTDTVASDKITNSNFIVCRNPDSTLNTDVAEGFLVGTAGKTILAIEALDNFTANFRVVFRTGEKWTDPEYTGFGDTVSIPYSVANIPAAVAGGIEMYGVDTAGNPVIDTDPISDDWISEGTKRAFFTDVSDKYYDLTHDFTVRWLLKDPNGNRKDVDIKNSSDTGANPKDDENFANYYMLDGDKLDSTIPGKWAIVAQVIDKDSMAGLRKLAEKEAGGAMTNNQFWKWFDNDKRQTEPEFLALFPATATSTFEFEVLERPEVFITPSNDTGIYDEYVPGDDAYAPYLTVGVSKWDSLSTSNITVRISVPKTTTDAVLRLDESEVKAYSEDVGFFYYDIELNKKNTSREIPFDMTTLDGKKKNGTKFALTALVTTDNFTLPSSGLTPSNFYDSASRTITLNNVKPTWDGLMPVSNEDRTSSSNTIAISSGNIPSIQWSVTDAIADMTNGIIVSIKGDGATLANPASELLFTNKASSVEVTELSGEFTPNFGEFSGKACIAITFTDLDGLKSETWYSRPYEVPAAKYLKTTAVGPSSGDARIDFIKAYTGKSAGGRGEGHTFVTGSGVTFWGASGFTLNWNCSSAPSVTAYARGYLADGTKDDGKLDKYDKALDFTGGSGAAANSVKAGTEYAYPDLVMDSFFYSWISPSTVADQETKTADVVYKSDPQPKIGKNTNDFAWIEIDLPSALNEDGNGYPNTRAYAVFAREKYAADNMGDINADGIPDYFAWDILDMENTELTAGSDLVDMKTFNDDGDFFPTLVELGKSQIIPGALSGWTTNGQAFVAPMEIRGFHDGLNFGMFKFDTDERANSLGGKWVSDISMSVLEKRALYRAAQTGTWATTYNVQAAALLDTLVALDPAVSDGAGGYVDEALLPDYIFEPWMDNLATDAVNWTNAQTCAKAFIDATWTGFGADSNTGWGFTVENRTNPLNPDTDGEGANYDISMDDGYEYYFWYGATVGFDNSIGRLTGRRMNLGDLEDTTSEEFLITSEEIARVFNPNIPRDWTEQDTDGDGILDYEEMLFGTSPIQWDTDGDGLSDLYELMYNLNPLKHKTDDKENDEDTNNDGDFMAHSQMDGTYRIVTHTNGQMFAFRLGTYSPDHAADASIEGNTEVTVNDDEDDEDRPDAATITISGTDINVSGKCFRVREFKGKFIPDALDCSTNMEIYASLTMPLAAYSNLYTFSSIDLYHHQVYTHFGFDPRTGWYSDNVNSSVSPTSRWKTGGGATFDAGLPVNTEKYTALDEFLMLKYSYITGRRSLADDLAKLATEELTIYDILKAGMTNPNPAYEPVVWNDSHYVLTEDQHGADTDGDGVPDGWELYVGVSPNIQFTDEVNETEYNVIRKSDAGDGLNLLGEYSGTDSCLAYSACESIYKHRPDGEEAPVKNWFNKFFPTDPRNSDTDGDGISDGNEGNEWRGSFTLNRWGQLVSFRVTHKSIYGEPTDSNGRTIRGGGFNPCSVDTDCDGLPDGWERQYAGIVFNGAEPYFNGEVASGRSDFLNGEYDDLRAALAAWGVSTNYTGTGYHVLMGMDGTVNDSYQPRVIGGEDLDWDGDGLENWQEYMIQAMRHLRYDDCINPLMGFDMDGLNASSTAVVPGEWVGTNGVIVLDLAYGLTDDELAEYDRRGYKNFAKFAKENPDYLGMMGYFTDPPREWDHVRCDYNYKYMFVPSYMKIEDRGVVTKPDTYIDGDKKVHTLWNYLTGDTSRVYTNDISNVYGFQPYTVTTPTSTNTYAILVSDFDATTGDPVFEQVEMRMLTTNDIQYTWSDGLRYISTDPRLWDSDGDGMDDYYEMFHGLNPIMGRIGELVTRITIQTHYNEDGTKTVSNSEYSYVTNSYDLVEMAYLGINAWQNAWQGWKNKDIPKYDPVRAPWLIGVGDADADGDGLRNYDEALNANMTSPNTTHTDPTPLWMTDTTVASEDFYVTHTSTSKVYKTYKGMFIDGTWYEWPKALWYTATNIVESTYTNSILHIVKQPSYVAAYYKPAWGWSDGNGSWGYADYAYDHEMNEGYDTDADFKSDLNEIKNAVEPASKPLDFTDIARRQSLWFGGDAEKGAAISYQPTERLILSPLFYDYFPNSPNSSNVDFFRQFTVEAWVRPENPLAGHDQYLVSRASDYGGWTLTKDSQVIRMNFALGIDADGYAFAELQGSTTDASARVRSLAQNDALAANTWVHLAATYDGKVLTLYVNGKVKETLATDIIPANGVGDIIQDPQGYAGIPAAYYRVHPTSTILGARANGPGAFSTSHASTNTWADIATDFFRGSISEVRIWDGARSAAQVLENYNVRFKTDYIKTQRQTIFAQFFGGLRRSDAKNNGSTMDPELVQHYSFTAMPGATEPQLVRIQPAGFEEGVLANVQVDGKRIDDSLKVGWWGNILTNTADKVGSTVYTSPYVVPWIQNTVSHLPKLDGTVADSRYWSESFAGYTPSSFHNLKKFDFPNQMNPYNLTWNYDRDVYEHIKFRNIEGETPESGAGVLSKYLFELRNNFSGTSDLLPLGSAFAKRLPESWDGQGSETPWADTVVDSDNDGLPDWWENAYGDIDPTTEVPRNGIIMSASEAYIRDLAGGMLPGRGIDSAYRNTEDFDADGLYDWWANLYGVTGAENDDDNDGLSNYTEFMLSELFDLNINRNFAPNRAKSVYEYDTDYFFRIGQLYAGEIFADHDFMEDLWEDDLDASYASRLAWDAAKDADEDGWSNYAECRYNKFTRSVFAHNISHMLDGEELKDMPVPTIALTLRYNGDQPLNKDNDITTNSLSSIIVQTFTKDGVVVPDATFTVTPGSSSHYEMHLGIWSERVVNGNLTPGYVQLNSVKLQSAKLSSANTYLWRVNVSWYQGAGEVVSNPQTSAYNREYTIKGSYEEYMLDYLMYGSRVALVINDSGWGTINAFSVTQNADTEEGNLCLNGKVIGSIDMRSGEFSLDMAELANGRISNAASVGSTNSTSNASSTNDTSSASGTYTVESAVFRLAYDSKLPQLGSNKMTLYLGDADKGYVKEGENTIVAFYDIDGNGRYTQGEPMGMTTADIGWHKSDLEIELTDTSPIISRADLLEASTDREAMYGYESGDNTNLIAGTLSGGRYERVRVIRTLVEDYGIQNIGIENRVIFDKAINLDQRSYFYEGDVLEDGSFDIDWNYFQDEVMDNYYIGLGQNKVDPMAVTYRVVLGNGDISANGTNNLYSIATVRHFDSLDSRTRPVVLPLGTEPSVEYSSRPTFKWTMKTLNPDTETEVNNNSYTAFKVQIRNGNNVVYDSGIRRAPPRDLDGVYTFVADAYVGDLLDPSVNYTWRVSMYNSKFQSDFWSEENDNVFRMNVTGSHIGKIKTCVRYFGPASILANAVVRVEAFKSADFTGAPVARTYVRAADVASVSAVNTPHVANATLYGLPEGKYYVRAYLDMNSRGIVRVKEPWESWGYVCPRDGSSPDMFTPSTIAIDDTVGDGETFDIYIEDADINGNNLPDAWEMQTRGKLDKGTENITDTLRAGVEINRELADNLQNVESASSTALGLAAHVYGVLSSSGVAALILDADVEEDGSRIEAVSAALGATTPAQATDVVVTSLATSPTGATLTLAGTAVPSAAKPKSGLLGADSQSFYSAGDDATGALVLYGTPEYTTDLASKKWTVAGKPVAIQVAADGTFKSDAFTIPQPEGVDKCFFRVIFKMPEDESAAGQE